MREWEAIVRASFVEISKTDAYSPLSILLLNHDRICEPIRVSEFCYRSYFEFNIELGQYWVRLFYLTGLWVGSILSSWHVILISIPGMSSAAQPNVYRFLITQAISSVFKGLRRLTSISTHHSGKDSLRQTETTGSQVGSRFPSKASAFCPS